MAILDQINIVAGGMRASMDFYKRLGVKLQEPAEGEDPHHIGGDAGGDCSLDLDSAKFAETWNAAWKGRSDLVGRVVIGFSFETREDIDRTFAELTGAGYKGLAKPWDAFWGSRYAIVEDPNGVAVGLMSPADPARRFWPPEGWEG
jgi:uncharacterized glyoxalase superfamily protein PhnB